MAIPVLLIVSGASWRMSCRRHERLRGVRQRHGHGRQPDIEHWAIIAASAG